ncbi:MAG: aminoacyl-tRNA hydrolase [Bdellovibrionaceae bacterium]|nr:aminoacyl-tRNA hydrolase [Pseudobdellovibrionaceae bacterium]
MKMIVGLGNPGPKYLMTRHNAGFLIVDALTQRNKINNYKEESKALVAKSKIDNIDVLIVKPLTYMNLSGEAVVPLLKYYKIEISDLLVVHDEVDLPFAKIKFQHNRGHGGHNGVRSLHNLMGSNDYSRLRFGIGRPSNPHLSVADFALQNFSNEEQKLLPEALSLAAEGVECFIVNGLNLTATRYNN